MKQKAFFLIILLSLTTAISAQSQLRQRLDSLIQVGKLRTDSLYRRADSLMKEHRVVQRLDSIIDVKHARQSFDKAYIRRPKERWTLKARLNLAGAYLGSISVNEGIKTKTDLNSDLKATINFAASYRGISLGLGVNPLKLFQKNSDYELNINSYGTKYGFDVVLQRANSLNGKIIEGKEQIHIPRGFITQTALTTNFYYTFNHRKFSWAAALTQSTEQLKSAGSFLLGASFQAIRTKNDGNPSLNLLPMRIYMGHVGIGGGYAYNYVSSKQWLIHGSFLPTLVIINRNNITLDGVRQKMPFYFPSVITTGRFAVIRYYRNYFAGLTAVVNTSVIGRSDHIRLTYTKWRTRLIFGLRF